MSETIDLPKRWPLVAQPMNRDESTDKDSKLVNCYVERGKDGDFYVYGRAGTARSSQPSGGAAAGRGLYNWRGDLYAAFGGLLYKNGVSLGTAIDTTNGVYRFVAALGGTPRMTLGNGVKAYTYDGATLALVTDVDFPSAFVKGWSYLDGTTYVGRSDAGIQGSDLNDTTAWNSLNVIIAQIEPDGGVAVSKQLVYTIIFKQWTTEVFYDAANSTGSPLGTVQGAKINYGCAHQDSVRDVDGVLYFLTTTRRGAVQVGSIDNLKFELVSDVYIDRLLQRVSLTTIYSLVVKLDGHTFYVVTSVGSNLTLAFDTKEKMWAQWTDSSGNYFPFVDAEVDSSRNTILQHESDGYLYTMSNSTLTDNSLPITHDIYTPQFDAGTKRGKYLPAILFDTDRTAGSELLVRCNDSDYAVDGWSDYRRVNLDADVPTLENEGTFYRRAYHFRHVAPTRFRVRAVDLQLDLCAL